MRLSTVTKATAFFVQKQIQDIRYRMSARNLTKGTIEDARGTGKKKVRSFARSQSRHTDIGCRKTNNA